MGIKKKVIKFENGKEVWHYSSATQMAKALGIHKATAAKLARSGKPYKGAIYKYAVVEAKGDKRNPVKCPYCDATFVNYNGLCKHVFRWNKHGKITQEQLLADYQYNGIRPKCKCGCEEYTDISYQGGAHFTDYKLGHHAKIHNNWGHNDSAKKHSAETRRRRFKSGEIVIWNKGTKWSETYDKKTFERLKEIVHSKERSEKISKALRGVPKSEEHRKKMMETVRKSFKIYSKGEKEFIEQFIKPLGVEYTTQKLITEINQFADVYIPSIDAYIEYDGDFWHCNPKVFPEGPKYQSQINKIERDKIKNQWMKDNGKKILRLWENDVKTNPEMIKEKIKKFIFPC